MELNVQAIRLAMAEKELNVRTLAKASGLSTTAINLWLNHGVCPRIDKLGTLAKALGVRVREIVIID